MKNSLALILGILSLTWSLDSSALPHRLVFENPVTIKGENIAVAVDLVRDFYDKKHKKYAQESEGEKTHLCSIEITLEGRDWASQNQNIGDHYYGNLLFDCEKSIEGWRKPFKSYFSKVQILGLQNCFFSETMRGDDYCNLAVIAYKTNLDLVSPKNENLITKVDVKKDLKEFYKIHSEAGWSKLKSSQLIPVGLNPIEISAAQVFGLNLSKNNAVAALPALQGQNFSSLRVGRVHALTVPPELSIGDEKTVEALVSLQNEMNALLASVASAAAPESRIPEISANFFALYHSHAETLLHLVNAANFSRYRSLQLNLEKKFLSLVQKYANAALSLSDFRQVYGDKFESYKEAEVHLKGGVASENLASLIADLFSMRSATSNSAQPAQFYIPNLNFKINDAKYVPTREDMLKNYTQQEPPFAAWQMHYFPHATIFVLKTDLPVGPNMKDETLTTGDGCFFSIELDSNSFTFIPAGSAFLFKSGNYGSSGYAVGAFYHNSTISSFGRNTYHTNGYGQITDFLTCAKKYFDIYYPRTMVGK